MILSGGDGCTSMRMKNRLRRKNQFLPGSVFFSPVSRHNAREESLEEEESMEDEEIVSFRTFRITLEHSCDTLW